MLQVENLAKRFEGIVATDDLVLTVEAGELHAIIGPNGAGKTTLIAQLGGQLMPDSGRIRFAGGDITTLPMYRRSPARPRALVPDHLLVSRSQRARQRGAGGAGACRALVPFLAQCPLAKRSCASRRVAALARVGLADRADRVTSALSHGEHRLIELAMALAGHPRMLLLDEPMAGLGPEESARMVEMLRALKKELTILLVEHDMEAVFALADRITVLVYGRVIATGAPAEIRANAAVRDAYLGEAEGTDHD